MADINAFLTQQAALPGKAGAAGQAGGKAGLFTAVSGVSFMDLIFARLTAEGKVGAQTESAKAEIISTTANTTEQTDPLTPQQILEAILEAGQTGETEVSIDTDAPVSPAPSHPETPELQLAGARKKLEKVLEILLAGLPEESKPTVIEVTPAQIHQLLGRINAAQSDDGAPALIATGLTPEDLTNLLEDIANGDEQGEAIFIGLANILPPEAKKDAIFLPRGVVVASPQHPAGDVSTPTSDETNKLAAKLNALLTGEGVEDAPEGTSKFEEVLRILEKAQANGQKTDQQNGNNGVDNAIEQITRKVSAGLSSIPGSPPALSAIFTSFATDSIYPEGMEYGTGAQHGNSLNATAQLTSIVSHTQQAGYPHPATQMVASAIAKVAQNGESKNITIQLDPPDLGKVSVRMELHTDSDKVKALIIAEKPETHMMLQRDAHVLERALQDAGLDVDGGALSFELSQDGNMFDHDQQHGAGSGGSGGSDGSADDETEMEIIETTMDWYADPESGLMRYSALV
ncbi:MAG: flagellar hook-length control protein FliK [Rhodospirillales bacterium]|nr:flagellar hook-length control protein FliK [Rhodospirillales bacterium]